MTVASITPSNNCWSSGMHVLRAHVSTPPNESNGSLFPQSAAHRLLYRPMPQRTEVPGRTSPWERFASLVNPRTAKKTRELRPRFTGICTHAGPQIPLSCDNTAPPTSVGPTRRHPLWAPGSPLRPGSLQVMHPGMAGRMNCYQPQSLRNGITM